MKTLDHRFRSAKADGADASQVQPSHWNDGHAFTGGANGYTLIRDVNDGAYGATWAPFGLWIPVPFDPTNFGTPTPGVTWTVAAGDVAVQRYAVVGLTMHYHVAAGGAIAGGSATELNIKMPAGYAINGLAVVPIFTVPNAIGVVVANPPTPGVLKITLLNGAVWNASPFVYAMLTLDVIPA
jgi:hypothetical protein